MTRQDHKINDEAVMENEKQLELIVIITSDIIDKINETIADLLIKEGNLTQQMLFSTASSVFFTFLKLIERNLLLSGVDREDINKNIIKTLNNVMDVSKIILEQPYIIKEEEADEDKMNSIFNRLNPHYH